MSDIMIEVSSIVQPFAKYFNNIKKVKEEPVYGPVKIVKYKTKEGEEVIGIEIVLRRFFTLYTCRVRNFDIVSKYFPRVEIHGEAIIKYLPDEYISKYIYDWGNRSPCEILNIIMKLPREEVELNTKTYYMPCVLLVEFKDNKIYTIIELAGNIDGVVISDLVSVIGFAKGVGLFTTKEFIKIPIPEGLFVTIRPLAPLLLIPVYKCINLNKGDKIYVGIMRRLLKWDCVYGIEFNTTKPFTVVYRTFRIPILGAFTFIVHGSTIIRNTSRLVISVY